MSAGAAACGCCSGVAERTPLTVQNRPGLSAVAYRTGTHPDFLAAMIAGLSDASRPKLADLTTRDSDDFTLALLDAWALSADVLTFYTERLQQEAYLRTARERISLQELGRLIGYRLRPGVAAETHVAFALEPPPELPPNVSQDPGAAPPVTPAAVTLEAGLRVQSIPGPGEQPQTFETVEEIEARPEWNAIPASTTIPFPPGFGDNHAYLVGATLNLKPGDPFLLRGVDVVGERWDVRTLSEVVPDDAAGRTLVRWAEGLGSLDPYMLPASPGTPYVLRKRANVFGHNAPLWKSMSLQFRKDYSGLDSPPGDWPEFDISPVANAVDLDGSHPDVVAGSWIVLSKPTYRELYRVLDVTELARAAFGISGKVTRLRLEAGENWAEQFRDYPRDTTVFCVSEQLALAEAPDDSDVAGELVDVDADLTALRPGRTVLVRGTTTAGEEHAEPAVLELAHATAGGTRLVLERPLSASYERGTVVVHANVALATHGETVQQLLGSGQARMAFQRFTLAQEPLTHVQSTDPSGASPALEVRVNDVLWETVPTLHGSGPSDRAYAVRRDEEGKTYVQFGDGEHGSRLPSGSNNVRATYRKGLGAAGNVGAGALAQLLDRPLGLKGASNPAPATGGVDPEPEEEARRSIPLAVRTLGRAVSLLDYEDLARAFAGVAKAHAAVLPLRAGRTVVVTAALAGTPPEEAQSRLEDLAVTLRTYGDPQVLVAVLGHFEQPFKLALRVAVDPAFEADAVLASVEAALRAAFAFDVRELAAPVHLSGVVSVVHSVAGVLAVDVDRLYLGSVPGRSERLDARQPSVGAGGSPVSAGLLVLGAAPLDWLEEMT